MLVPLLYPSHEDLTGVNTVENGEVDRQALGLGVALSS